MGSELMVRVVGVVAGVFAEASVSALILHHWSISIHFPLSGAAWYGRPNPYRACDHDSIDGLGSPVSACSLCFLWCL